MTATTYPRSQRFGPGGQPIPESPSNSTPPTGPRSSSSRYAAPPTGPSGSLTATSTTTKPGIHPALADLAKPIEGGEKLPPIIDRSRLDKLQEEAEKLRRQIEEKETRKRKGLREWDRLSREVEVAGLRTQLAEESLRKLSGEVEGAAAF